MRKNNREKTPSYLNRLCNNTTTDKFQWPTFEPQTSIKVLIQIIAESTLAAY